MLLTPEHFRDRSDCIICIASLGGGITEQGRVSEISLPPSYLYHIVAACLKESPSAARMHKSTDGEAKALRSASSAPAKLCNSSSSIEQTLVTFCTGS